MSKNLP
ncbi:hypothetical protein YPPY04_3219, partial [Yersinia pestis PY-04]|jgi:hypothetical protein